MIAAIYIQTKHFTMKKLLLLVTFAIVTYFGTSAQTSPGNSAYGHSHKKAKKIHKHHHHQQHTVIHREADERKAINVQHKTTIRTIKDNDALTNEQQKDMVKQANVTHKTEMKNESMMHKGGKKK